MSAACTVVFGGFFQSRLAIDPDAYDEPWGRLGNACALPGEPAFDRVIQTWGARACVRSHCPPIGLEVIAVEADVPACAPALMGASVRLLPGTAEGGPFFESRSNLIAVQLQEPLSAFSLALQCRDGTLLRGDAAKEVPPRVKPVDPWRAVLDGRAATIATAPECDRPRRKRALEQDLRAGVIAQSVYERRCKWLDEGIAQAAIYSGLAMYFVATLDAGATSRAPALPVDFAAPWELVLRFGWWDADAMSGVLVGQLTLPML